ncbi:MAG: undecaprenyl/decaprenyl-phosphate alpha-N-acetylglucosaminyl 1-phosphate transferase [Bryobacterales bacterium]|nr:undecaprenyl/decaprenyl-phosphate alpha-N-acetylglucosaminyl 1-phosphate transferase [Bryobacterales bacterium]
MLVLFDLGFVAFFFSLVLTPFVRRGAQRFGLVDKPDQTRKFHANPIPRIGGVGIVAAYLLSCGFILVAPYQNVPFDIQQALRGGISLLPAALAIFATGLIDDVVHLRPWQKLAGQIFGAVLAFHAGFGIYVFRDTVLPYPVAMLVTVFWLVGCSNAFNLIDGMDGLAAGVGLFATLTTLASALVHNNLELAMATVPLAGALLGFLRYNFNPASIFLGDCGSLVVGFLLGCFGALWSQKSATVLGMTAPLMAMAIPLLDVGLSIVRRFLRGQPIFGADRGHIHHRLLARGLTTRRAALILYAICGVGAAFSLVQDAFSHSIGSLVILLFCAVAWLGIQHLGYAELGIARRVLFKGTLRNIISLQLHLQELERDFGEATTLDGFWKVLVKGCEDFGFGGVRLNVQGRVLEKFSVAEPPSSLWQLRVPLPDSQYVNLYGRANATTPPAALVGLAQVIERSIHDKLRSFEQEVLRDGSVAEEPAAERP